MLLLLLLYQFHSYKVGISLYVDTAVKLFECSSVYNGCFYGTAIGIVFLHWVYTHRSNGILLE